VSNALKVAQEPASETIAIFHRSLIPYLNYSLIAPRSYQVRGLILMMTKVASIVYSLHMSIFKFHKLTVDLHIMKNQLAGRGRSKYFLAISSEFD
jgi:hypothetical protein